MNRRDFFKGLFAVSAGLILPTQAQALILGDRYARLVASIRDVVDKGEPYRRGIEAWIAADDGSYTIAAENMFRVIEEEFSDMTPFVVDPYATCLKIYQMFYVPRTVDFDILSEDELRRHEDLIISVGVARVLLTQYNIPVIVGLDKKGEHFRSFFRRLEPIFFGDIGKRAHNDALEIDRQAYLAQRAKLIA